MEASLQGYYQYLCTIVRRTKADDAYGGQTETPVTIATNVRCDLIPSVQRLRAEEVLGSQVESRQTYDVKLPPGTDIKIHDRLTLTNITPNREMVVMAVLTPVGWELERDVVCSLEGEPIVF